MSNRTIPELPFLLDEQQVTDKVSKDDEQRVVDEVSEDDKQQVICKSFC